MDQMDEKMIYQTAQDCVRCGTCRVIYADRIKSFRFGTQCPPAQYYKIESFTPAGRMYTAVGIMREVFPCNKRAVETFYACTQCGYCQNICEEYGEVQTMPVIEAMRNRAVKEGAGPLPEQRKYMENFKKTGNIYAEPKKKRFAWLDKFKGTVKDISRGEKADVLYYVGPNYSFNKYTEYIPLGVAGILQRAGLDWGILGADERSSGYHALTLGYREIFKQTARENIEAFNRLGVKKILVSCPEDYYTFKLRYAEIATLDAEVIHVAELFHSLIKDNRLQLAENRLKVTYHDPCHLGRYCSLYEAPRDVIKSIPGIELLEMERNRRDAWCCGAGGGVKLGSREYAVATAKERVAEAESSGAEVLVTACPLCIENFIDAKAEENSSIQILDIATLLARSL